MNITGFLLIIAMIGLFVSQNIILYKIIKDNKKYSICWCYICSILMDAMITLAALLSFTYILTTIFIHSSFYSGLLYGLPFSAIECIYMVLLFVLPITQIILTVILQIKYTVKILKKVWYYPLIPLFINTLIIGVLLCLILK